MSKLVAHISMSLDGFVAGAEDGLNSPMGIDGERLHDWFFAGGEALTANGRSNREIAHEPIERAGSVIIGKRMFDNAEVVWGDAPPFGRPVFVLSHTASEPVTRHGGEVFTFVTTGIAAAADQARAAAKGKDVFIAGGGNVVHQFVRAGLLDELQIHLVPLLLGQGRRLFDPSDAPTLELTSIDINPAPGVTHLTYCTKH